MSWLAEISSRSKRLVTSIKLSAGPGLQPAAGHITAVRLALHSRSSTVVAGGAMKRTREMKRERGQSHRVRINPKVLNDPQRVRELTKKLGSGRLN